ILPLPSTTTSFQPKLEIPLRSACRTIDPSGSLRSSSLPVTSRRPSGSQSMDQPRPAGLWVKNWTMCLTSVSPFLKKLRHEALQWTFLQSSFALSSGRRGKNTSVLDKEECSTNGGTKLLMVCSFCGDLPWAPCAIRHLAWEGLNTHQGRLQGVTIFFREKHTLRPSQTQQALHWQSFTSGTQTSV